MSLTTTGRAASSASTAVLPNGSSTREGTTHASAAATNGVTSAWKPCSVTRSSRSSTRIVVRSCSS